MKRALRMSGMGDGVSLSWTLASFNLDWTSASHIEVARSLHILSCHINVASDQICGYLLPYLLQMLKIIVILYSKYVLLFESQSLDNTGLQIIVRDVPSQQLLGASSNYFASDIKCLAALICLEIILLREEFDKRFQQFCLTFLLKIISCLQVKWPLGNIAS